MLPLEVRCHILRDVCTVSLYDNEARDINDWSGWVRERAFASSWPKIIDASQLLQLLEDSPFLRDDLIFMVQSRDVVWFKDTPTLEKFYDESAELTKEFRTKIKEIIVDTRCTCNLSFHWELHSKIRFKFSELTRVHQIQSVHLCRTVKYDWLVHDLEAGVVEEYGHNMAGDEHVTVSNKWEGYFSDWRAEYEGEILPRKMTRRLKSHRGVRNR